VTQWRCDHLNTCTAHSGAKKAHDRMVDQIADLFRTTLKVKTQQVIKSRGVELSGFLPNPVDPVSLVMHLRITLTSTGVVLTLVLTDIYITLMILIGHLMRIPLTRSESIELTTTITLLTLYHLYLLFLVRLRG
jgi:hypothetical protein